uniref:Uncharacterized protein n=1 Tax=Labrus bergylta TaxID=56723 RepID=A0A3Q3FVP4_9LABR
MIHVFEEKKSQHFQLKFRCSSYFLKRQSSSSCSAPVYQHRGAYSPVICFITVCDHGNSAGELMLKFTGRCYISLLSIRIKPHGNEVINVDKAIVSSLGVTHIMNAAAGRHSINTGLQFYAADHPEFDLQPLLKSITRFIGRALKGHRSGALVLAYLMIYIGPNSGFLEQLRRWRRA